MAVQIQNRREIHTDEEQLKKQPQEELGDKQLEPIKDPNDFMALYGHDDLALKNGPQKSKVQQTIAPVHNKKPENSESGIYGKQSAKKKPFQPEDYDIAFTGTEADLRKNPKDVPLKDAESRLGERPPVSVFDERIGARDRIQNLKQRLAQLEVTRVLKGTQDSSDTDAIKNQIDLEKQT